VENSIAALSDVVFPLAKRVSDFRAHSSWPWDSPVDLRLDEKTSFSSWLINRLTACLFRAARSKAKDALHLQAYWLLKVSNLSLFADKAHLNKAMMSFALCRSLNLKGDLLLHLSS